MQPPRLPTDVGAELARSRSDNAALREKVADLERERRSLLEAARNSRQRVSDTDHRHATDVAAVIEHVTRLEESLEGLRTNDESQNRALSLLAHQLGIGKDLDEKIRSSSPPPPENAPKTPVLPEVSRNARRASIGAALVLLLELLIRLFDMIPKGGHHL